MRREKSNTMKRIRAAAKRIAASSRGRDKNRVGELIMHSIAAQKPRKIPPAPLDPLVPVEKVVFGKKGDKRRQKKMAWRERGGKEWGRAREIEVRRRKEEEQKDSRGILSACGPGSLYLPATVLCERGDVHGPRRLNEETSVEPDAPLNGEGG